ncbi:flavin reductase family protein [Aeromicrobium sp. CF4.19]|uniref:flavin reductase family protein n=1 Tax=Aeromicrobium sp. CF4.19 TaxID=3373082 RepID=UPI003EE4B837
MTIHTDHPFQPGEGDRDPLRRFRGRMSSAVSVITTGSHRRRAGLTVSSFVVAEGDPGRVLALLDEDSTLWDARPERVVVNLLAIEHAWLAEAFAGLVPAPGGPFTLGEWTASAWGPVLTGAAGWLGVAVDRSEPRGAGWSVLLEGSVEHVQVGEPDALTHVRGRYGG